MSGSKVKPNKPKSKRAAHLGPHKRRPEVLDTALDLAAECGIRAVTMEQVAERMGVTKPVVYSCFPSRQALVVALVEREEQRLLQGVIAALPNAPDFQNPRQLIIDGFKALLNIAAVHSKAWQLVFMAEPDPLVSERYGQARILVTKMMVSLLKEGLAKWARNDAELDIEVLAEFIMSTGDGAVRSQIKSPDRESSEKLGELTGKLVFGALREIVEERI